MEGCAAAWGIALPPELCCREACIKQMPAWFTATISLQAECYACLLSCTHSVPQKLHCIAFSPPALALHCIKFPNTCIAAEAACPPTLPLHSSPAKSLPLSADRTRPVCHPFSLPRLIMWLHTSFCCRFKRAHPQTNARQQSSAASNMVCKHQQPLPGSATHVLLPPTPRAASSCS